MDYLLKTRNFILEKNLPLKCVKKIFKCIFFNKIDLNIKKIFKYNF